MDCCLCKGNAHIAPRHLRSAASGAAMSKPSGEVRSLHSLSACGLPTPVVALACIGNVCFLVQVVNFISYSICKLVEGFCEIFC